MFECGKCNGKGLIREFGHVQFGRCFECAGTGKVSNKAKSTVANESAERIISDFGNCARFYTTEEWSEIVAWVHRAFERGENNVEIRHKLSDSTERRVKAYWAEN